MLIYREREAPEPIIPLRLFANRIFAVACLISLSMSMVMIAMIILVPLDFELGAGLTPNEAGLRLIPMTGGTVLGSFIVGRLVSRTGHYRIFPILGAGAMTILCGAIAAVGLGRSWPLDTFLTALLGFSFGAQLPSVMVPVQNALDLPDTGVGLSVVMFFRLIGRRVWGRSVDGATGRRSERRRPGAPGPRCAGPSPRYRASPSRSAGRGQSGAVDRLAARSPKCVFSGLFMGRGYFGAHPGSLVRIEGDPVARRLTETSLSFDRTSALLAPAADSFLQKVDPGNIRPPGFREIGAFAAGSAIGRQIVKANVHRQRHAFSECDRLLGSHARQRRQSFPAPHPATPSP